MRWQQRLRTGSEIARDVLTWPTGLAIVIHEAFFTTAPNEWVMIVGGALVIPSLAAHGLALWSGQSLPSPPRDGCPPSSSPPALPRSRSRSGRHDGRG